MKVILKQNVRKLGNKGDIVEVAEGYAYNSLIPQKIAEIATKAILSKVEGVAKAAKKAAEQEKIDSIRIIKELDGKTIELKKTVTQKGSLFSAVHLSEVLEVTEKETGEKVPEELIQNFKDIKNSGVVEVLLQFEKVKGSYFINIHG